MARNSKVTKKSGARRAKPAPAGRVRRGRPKVCAFCSDGSAWVDYKDVSLLRRFMSERGRIRARGATGTCAQHQRDVAVAIKTARELALLPYAVQIAGGEGRGRRGREPRRAEAAGTSDDSASTSTPRDAGAAGEAGPRAGDDARPSDDRVNGSAGSPVLAEQAADA